MKHIQRIVMTAALCMPGILCSSCSEVLFIGRSQLTLIPDATMNNMALQEYNQFMQKNKKSTNTANAAMVQRVGARVTSAVERFCRENNMSDRLTGFNWEFNLIESKEVNAWAMPGGKVVVYTGILPITRDEAGLAVVVAHEIAHVVARHGNERMSQALIIDMGGIALDKALASKPEETKKLFAQAFGVTANISYILPYSRLHENEADRLGLMFMAMAGYDPQVAVEFWQRMAIQKTNVGKGPEFLSTHPADDTRIANIQSYLPQAMSYYQQNKTY